MENKIIIYHGSQEIIDTPTFGKGKLYNDFGLGFYCTLYEHLAKEWSVNMNKFVSIMDELMNKHFNDTNLKRLRKKKGYSQKELSIKSNTSLRSIQMYEQRNKDINKANASTLYCLALALDCKIEDLLEM